MAPGGSEDWAAGIWYWALSDGRRLINTIIASIGFMMGMTFIVWGATQSINQRGDFIAQCVGYIFLLMSAYLITVQVYPSSLGLNALGQAKTMRMQWRHRLKEERGSSFWLYARLLIYFLCGASALLFLRQLQLNPALASQFKAWVDHHFRWFSAIFNSLAAVFGQGGQLHFVIYLWPFFVVVPGLWLMRAARRLDDQKMFNCTVEIMTETLSIAREYYRLAEEKNKLATERQ